MAPWQVAKLRTPGDLRAGTPGNKCVWLPKSKKITSSWSPYHRLFAPGLRPPRTKDDLSSPGLQEELHLAGFEKAMDKTLDMYQDQFKTQKHSQSKLKPIPGQGEYHYKHQTSKKSDTNILSTFIDQVDAGKLVLPLNTTKEDLEAHLDSIMVKAEYGGIKYTCRVCGQADKNRSRMREHIEIHIEGLSFPCNMCGKVSRTSHCLRDHIRKYHAE